MKCFIHRDTDAVGSCKACHKGLCAACAADHGYALSCKGACEQRVADHELSTRRSSALANVQRRYRYAAATFILLIGLAFAGWGVWYGRPWNFLTLIGAAFIVYGLVMLRANLHWASDAKAAQAE